MAECTRCPYCGRPFKAGDIHRPVRCPHCGAVIVFRPPDFRPEVLLTPTDVIGSEGG